MKKIFVLPIIAATCAAGPALAQTSPETPFPSRNMPGTGTEQRDDNVWQGAIESSRPALPSGEVYTGRASVAEPPPAEPLYADPYGGADGAVEAGDDIDAGADVEGLGIEIE